jgi:hypothetical protein
MSSDETAADTAADIEMETVGVDEMVRQERVRSIFEAKREAREARTKGGNEEAVGHSKVGAVIYRNALETYIREVEPLFSQTPKGRHYWTDHDFGEVDLRPRHEDIDRSNQQTGVIRRARPIGEQKEKQRMEGIRSLFDAPTVFRVSFRVPVESKRRGHDETYRERVSKTQIPIDVLDEMYAVTNGYLAEIGFGVEVGKAEQHTKLDDDLLDEVEAWRRENL